MKTQGMPREGDGRIGHGVCPHLMLIHLDGLDFLGCPEVCGGRTMRSALLAAVSLTTVPPSNRTLTYPKVAQLRPPHPTAPRGSAPSMPGSGYSLCGPGGPAAEGGPVSQRRSRKNAPTPIQP